MIQLHQKQARKTGLAVEQWVATRLQQQGLSLIQSNFQCPLGEIDLIMQHHNELIFFEIKYRKKTLYGSGQEAVTVRKKQRIIKTAQWFLQKHPHWANAPCRFDVIAVHHTPQEWHWIKHAFDAF